MPCRIKRHQFRNCKYKCIKIKNQLVGILVEEKNDVAAFANYKDESGASAPAQPQEKKIEVKVEATTTASGPSQQKAQSAPTEKTSTGNFRFYQF